MLLKTILTITLTASPATAPSTSDIPGSELQDQLTELATAHNITAGLVHVRDSARQRSELLAVAWSNAPPFEPTPPWRYSNTNYVVAGLLIEKLTTRPYGEEVARRILSPLNLRHTSVPGHRASLPTPHAHGYEPLPEIVDATKMAPSLGLQEFTIPRADGPKPVWGHTGQLIGYVTVALTDGKDRTLVLSLNPYEQDPPVEKVLAMGVTAFCR